MLDVVRRIPPGLVATYGDVAALAGRPRAHRAVGTIMRTCEDPQVPCHRVVAAGGRLGGFGEPHRKRELLEAEGVWLTGERIRRWSDVRWQPRRRTPSGASGRTSRARNPSDT